MQEEDITLNICQKLKYSSDYLLIALLYLISILPLRALQALGGSLGKLASTLPRSLVRPARSSDINIKLCYPEKTSEERHQLTQDSLIETGKTLFELARVWCRPAETSFNDIKKIHNEHLFTDAIKENNGVILIAIHQSNWEVLASYLSTVTPSNMMYKPNKSPVLDQFVINARTRIKDIGLVPTSIEGIRGSIKLLKKKGTLAILSDHAPGLNNNPRVPFFNIPTLTTPILHRLRKISNSKVLCIYTHRLPKGQGFEVHFTKAAEGIYSSDRDKCIGAMNKTLENTINHYPKEYQWSYKRFDRAIYRKNKPQVQSKN